MLWVEGLGFIRTLCTGWHVVSGARGSGFGISWACILGRVGFPLLTDYCRGGAGGRVRFSLFVIYFPPPYPRILVHQPTYLISPNTFPIPLPTGSLSLHQTKPMPCWDYKRSSTVRLWDNYSSTGNQTCAVILNVVALTAWTMVDWCICWLQIPVMQALVAPVVYTAFCEVEVIKKRRQWKIIGHRKASILDWTVENSGFILV